MKKWTSSDVQLWFKLFLPPKFSTIADQFADKNVNGDIFLNRMEKKDTKSKTEK